MSGLAGLSFCTLVAAGTLDGDFWSKPNISRFAFCQQLASSVGVFAQSLSKQRGPRPCRSQPLREDDIWQGQAWGGRDKRMGPKKYGAATREMFRRRELAGLPRVPDHLKPQWEQIVDEHDERMSREMTNAQLLAADESERKALAEQSAKKKALEQPDDSVDRKRLRDIDEAFPQALPEKWEPPGFRKEKPREQKWTEHLGEVTNLEHPREAGQERVQKNIRWLQNKKKAVAAIEGVFGTKTLTSARSMKGKMLLEQARRLQSLQLKPVTTSTLDNL